jgi:UDP-galactopyranose mutase
VACEYPRTDGDPYYPVPRAENAALYKLYEAEAEQLEDVTSVGRLATYEHHNMDQVVDQALTAFKRLRQRCGAQGDAATLTNSPNSPATLAGDEARPAATVTA